MSKVSTSSTIVNIINNVNIVNNFQYFMSTMSTMSILSTLSPMSTLSIVSTVSTIFWDSSTYFDISQTQNIFWNPSIFIYIGILKYRQFFEIPHWLWKLQFVKSAQLAHHLRSIFEVGSKKQNKDAHFFGIIAYFLTFISFQGALVSFKKNTVNSQLPRT